MNGDSLGLDECKMDNNHSQTLQAGSSEKLLPSAPASTSPFPPDVKATTGLTEVQVRLCGSLSLCKGLIRLYKDLSFCLRFEYLLFVQVRLCGSLNIIERFD
jgi:hypothetical protein